MAILFRRLIGNKAIERLYWHHDAEGWYRFHEARGWMAPFPREYP